MERQEIHKEQQPDWIEELLPEGNRHKKTYTIHATGQDVWRIVKLILNKANGVKISIWHDQRPLATIPALYGGFAVALFPFLSLFSMISLLTLNCRIIVEKQ